MEDPPAHQGEIIAQHSSSGDGLSFVDFPPRYLDCGTGKPRYDTFGSLMQRANTWLTSRPHLEVKTCESYEMKSGQGMLDKESMIYHEPGTSCTYCYRGLRLWLVPRRDNGKQPQQLGFVNIVPKTLTDHGSQPVFENLDQMAQRFNVTSKVNPIPGRILTIESQDIITNNFVLMDPDVSFFEEHSSAPRNYLIILRVFYEVQSPKLEEIGLLDFIPTRASGSRSKSQNPSDYEPFSFVVHRASRWCSEQRHIRYTNAQSLELKLKSGKYLDTKKMSYTEHVQSTTNFIRILRVAYVCAKSLTTPEFVPTLELSCKTFVPYQATSGVLEFESLTQTRRRIETWCKETKARVVSCETSAMRLKTGGEASLGVEASFTFNLGQYDEYWVYVIRLYLDGIFVDPPCTRSYSSRSLMAPPIVEEEQCCVIL